MAYQKIVPTSFDQCYIFAKQLRSEDLALRHVDHIVTDSPLLMQCSYVKKYNSPFYDELFSLCKKFGMVHKSLNIFLDREGLHYQQDGRYENPLQAAAMDVVILSTIEEAGEEYTMLPAKNIDSVISFVLDNLDA
jgi:hypothetical protein